MYNSGTDKNKGKLGERMKIMMFCGQCAFCGSLMNICHVYLGRFKWDFCCVQFSTSWVGSLKSWVGSM